MTFVHRRAVIGVPQAPICPKLTLRLLFHPASPIHTAPHAYLATSTNPTILPTAVARGHRRSQSRTTIA